MYYSSLPRAVSSRHKINREFSFPFYFISVIASRIQNLKNNETPLGLNLQRRPSGSTLVPPNSKSSPNNYEEHPRNHEERNAPRVKRGTISGVKEFRKLQGARLVSKDDLWKARGSVALARRGDGAGGLSAAWRHEGRWKKKWEAISVVSLFRGGTRPGVRQGNAKEEAVFRAVSYCLGPRCI